MIREGGPFPVLEIVLTRLIYFRLNVQAASGADLFKKVQNCIVEKLQFYWIGLTQITIQDIWLLHVKEFQQIGPIIKKWKKNKT